MSDNFVLPTSATQSNQQKQKQQRRSKRKSKKDKYSKDNYYYDEDNQNEEKEGYNENGDKEEIDILKTLASTTSTVLMKENAGHNDKEEKMKGKKKKKRRSSRESKQKRGPWTQTEDEILLSAVKKYGAQNWTYLSQFIPLRIGKQCRERYYNHLDPSVRRAPWSHEEDKLIIKYHGLLGNKWTEISKAINNGRPPNSIKNRWNSTLKRKLGLNNNDKSKRGDEDDDDYEEEEEEEDDNNDDDGEVDYKSTKSYNKDSSIENEEEEEDDDNDNESEKELAYKRMKFINENENNNESEEEEEEEISNDNDNLENNNSDDDDDDDESNMQFVLPDFSEFPAKHLSTPSMCIKSHETSDVKGMDDCVEKAYQPSLPPILQSGNIYYNTIKFGESKKLNYNVKIEKKDVHPHHQLGNNNAINEQQQSHFSEQCSLRQWWESQQQQRHNSNINRQQQQQTICSNPFQILKGYNQHPSSNSLNPFVHNNDTFSEYNNFSDNNNFNGYNNNNNSFSDNNNLSLDDVVRGDEMFGYDIFDEDHHEFF